MTCGSGVLETKEEGEKRQNFKETKTHLKAMVLRTKPARGQHMAAIDSSKGSIWHGRFRARRNDNHKDLRLPVKGDKFSRKCRGKVSQTCE